MKRDFSTEFQFVTSRSSGPGGQNVNKVNSKVELRFNVGESLLLTEDEKILLFEKLVNRISTDGILQIICQEDRSQLKNKLHCIHKFYLCIENALHRSKLRLKTKPSRASKQRRLDSKKKQAQKKNERSSNYDDRSFFVST